MLHGINRRLTVINISIDESGNFEDKNTKCKFIGGVVYTGVDIEEEEKRIDKLFKEVCGSFNIQYPRDMHTTEMKSFNSREIKEKIKLEVIKYLKNSGKYHFTLLLKSNSKRKDYDNLSNFIDENNASNLYEHMVCSLVNNLVFYNYKQRNEEKFQLNLATRVAVVGNNELERITEYKKLGYNLRAKEKDKETDNNIFYLTDSKTFKASLSSKMMECKFKKNIDLDLNVKSTNYKNEKDSTTPFLYLADFACDIIKETLDYEREDFNIMETNKKLKSFTGLEPYIWIYDDIDTLLSDLVINFYNKNYMYCLDNIYKIDNCDSAFKDYYKKYWVKGIENELNTCFSTQQIKIYISEVEYLLNKDVKKYKEGLFKGKRLLENIEKITKKNVDSYIYKVCDILMRCNNHIGNLDEAYKFYSRCEELKNKVSIYDYISTLIRQGEIYDNELDFKKSLVIKKSIYEHVSFLKENNDYIAKELHMDLKAMPGLPSMGKVLSSIGQTYAFMRNKNEALKYFEKAIEEFGNDNINKNITLSYLMHLAIDSKDKVLYEKYSQDYFGEKDLYSQYERVVLKNDTNHSNDFKLFVYVKALSRMYFNSSNYHKILDMLQCCNYKEQGFAINEHPWELIYKELAFMHIKLGKPVIAEKLCDKAVKAIDNSGTTIKLINSSTMLSLYKHNNNMNMLSKEIKKLEDIFNENKVLKETFKEVIEAKDLEEKGEEFLKKFTYMYC